ncbi:hypothetical protein WGT02_24360 (plasmid) [Rhizobium sp. T1470]|uniref:hypothetical protein n=1 Tax=unclassified Rhizobium TaxID=2613769 RepID=UPI001AB00A10|nr:hypothetical protein [Rhizobium sp. T1473]MCA0804355.1 hypothetical protein [Rhizobium sp. T1473]
MIKRVVDFFGDEVYASQRRRLFYLALVVIVIADFLVPRDEHAEYLWDQLPGWSAVYGFLSCILLIFVSKFLGHQGGLMRREDYYD